MLKSPNVLLDFLHPRLLRSLRPLNDYLDLLQLKLAQQLVIDKSKTIP
jgi:hypothetical protein